jgi:hypothetical protein
MKPRIFILLAILIMTLSCSQQPNEVVAQFKDKTLGRSSLLSLMPQDYSPSDSADIANQIIQHWIEAEWWKDLTKESEWTDENELQLEQYRQILLMQNWKNQYLSENLDSIVTSDQIQGWRAETGDSLNKFSATQVKEVILQNRRNNIITTFMTQSLIEAEKSGIIKRPANHK